MADPSFVEVKAFVSVGYSKQRLSYENMPLHDEVVAFAHELGKHLGMKIVDEQRESRVVLLMKRDLASRKLKFV